MQNFSPFSEQTPNFLCSLALCNMQNVSKTISQQFILFCFCLMYLNTNNRIHVEPPQLSGFYHCHTHLQTRSSYNYVKAHPCPCHTHLLPGHHIIISLYQSASMSQDMLSLFVMTLYISCHPQYLIFRLFHFHLTWKSCAFRLWHVVVSLRGLKKLSCIPVFLCVIILATLLDARCNKQQQWEPAQCTAKLGWNKLEMVSGVHTYDHMGQFLQYGNF